MEDYAGAFAARYLDVEALLRSVPQRRVAAAHIGGVAVECHLKALILTYHGITAWSQVGRRARDTYYGRSIERPGHGLMTAIKQMSDLYAKAKSDPSFIQHLNQVMRPVGSTNVDFIDLRYVAQEMSSANLADWQKSLNYVAGWLRKNEEITL